MGFFPDLNEDSGDEMSTDSIWSEQFGMLKDDLNMTEQVADVKRSGWMLVV